MLINYTVLPPGNPDYTGIVGTILIGVNANKMAMVRFSGRSVELYNTSVLFCFLFYYCYLHSHAALEYIDLSCLVFHSSVLFFL